ncbi:MAG: methyl-accepting chemotaxis protein [Desulfuromonas sp.]|nr:methyl-accepting chemotaxis protein [Desulfuromonas sp.]
MNWFQNITTQAKIIFGFGLMLVIMMIIVGMAYRSIEIVSTSQQELLKNDFLPSIKLIELQSDVNRARVHMLELMMAGDDVHQQEVDGDLRACIAEIDKEMDILAVSSDSNSEFIALFQQLLQVRKAYKKTREDQLTLIYAGKAEMARQMGMGKQQERYLEIRRLIIDLGQMKMAQALQRLDRAKEHSQKTLLLFVGAGIVAILLSVAMAIVLKRVIANPLQEITELAQLVACGETDVNAPISVRRDEVGILIQSFRSLVETMSGYAEATRRIASGDLSTTVVPKSERDVMGNALADMVISLREITKEMVEGVGVLAASSSEIMASASQVTSGAAETAAAVSQTTSTVEEVKQTAIVSNKKARGVSDSAQKAVQVAKGGRNAVNESITGMNLIQDQVEAIAESIVRLSEQSQAIGEIIASVNDLAEQSNLLAVNAAIEAAKAGEHGKWFAVVAQEVKNLAAQSKEATAQVRAILNDIQKATNAAVMATEQGNKAVATGVSQTQEAGDVIRQIGESIDISAQAALQIAASSQQQLTGMDQVTMAMESIKQASEQNVTGMRQVESTAQGLHDLGQKLKNLVARFRV